MAESSRGVGALYLALRERVKSDPELSSFPEYWRSEPDSSFRTASLGDPSHSIGWMLETCGNAFSSYGEALTDVASGEEGEQTILVLFQAPIDIEYCEQARTAAAAEVAYVLENLQSRADPPD